MLELISAGGFFFIMAEHLSQSELDYPFKLLEYLNGFRISKVWVLCSVKHLIPPHTNKTICVYISVRFAFLHVLCTLNTFIFEFQQNKSRD